MSHFCANAGTQHPKAAGIQAFCPDCGSQLPSSDDQVPPTIVRQSQTIETIDLTKKDAPISRRESASLLVPGQGPAEEARQASIARTKQPPKGINSEKLTLVVSFWYLAYAASGSSKKPALGPKRISQISKWMAISFDCFPLTTSSIYFIHSPLERPDRGNEPLRTRVHSSERKED